jgi:hypothetical protein
MGLLYVHVPFTLRGFELSAYHLKTRVICAEFEV